MKTRQDRNHRDLVVGIDCSTTSTKARAYNSDGKMVAHAHEPVPLSSPKPNQFEQDSDDWWQSACRALKAITRQVGPERIAALAISNQRETFVALGVNGQPLRPAIVWLDERCKDQVAPFSKKIGTSRIHRITGKPPDYAPVVYRLAWMKKNERTLYKRISMICDVHTYLVWKLTGSFKTSWASADPLGLFDVGKREWSSVILRALDLKEDQLPAAYRPGTVLGRVSADASSVTGLTGDTLIVAGGGDGQMAGLGSNVLTPNRAYLNLGTAVVAGVYAKAYRVSEAFRTMISGSEAGYYYECSLRAGTFSTNWFIRHVLKIDPLKQPDVYGELEREAEQIAVGSDGLFYLPYLCGVMNPYWDMNARGAFVGLSSSHTRGHMFRAILEGIAFEQRLALNAVEEATGITVQELMAIGGGAESNLWCHILADVTGKRICIPGTNEASSLAAAIAAAVATGWYRTFSDAANAMTSVKDVVQPERRKHKTFTRLFMSYKKIYPLLDKIES